jgi:large subunit ribosomal protein L1
MDAAKVSENAQAVVQEIIRKKPSDAKGDYIGTIAIASTMGPGVHINTTGLLSAATV